MRISNSDKVSRLSIIQPRNHPRMLRMATWWVGYKSSGSFPSPSFVAVVVSTVIIERIKNDSPGQACRICPRHTRPEKAIPVSMNLTESLDSPAPILDRDAYKTCQKSPTTLFTLISSAFQCVRMTLSDRSAHQWPGALHLFGCAVSTPSTDKTEWWTVTD